MSLGPKIPKKDPFDQTLRGTFGRFKTVTSREVFYLLCSIPIEEIEDLATASDFFEADALKFEELIQRDIDKARVIRMAEGYLKATSDKVVFFPPLLACIVLFDPEGKMLHQYAGANYAVSEEEGVRQVKAVWDDDGFELALALADKKTADRRIAVNGTEEWFHDAGQLRLNRKRAKLIVLDGQHRLEAMKLVRSGPSKDVLAGTEVPVCLVFTPSAVVGSQEDVVENFRELFVRVNEEAKRVSGHFIILLQDDSYAAMAVRALAEAWRKKKQDGLTYLHLLEWNQRVEENTRRRTRPFSITTIGILTDILRDYLFEEHVAATILRLDDAKAELEAADPSYHYADIADEAHSAVIDKIVGAQIELHLVPALDILLLSPPPYIRFVTSVTNAFSKMDAQANAHVAAFGALQEYFRRYKYTEEEVVEPVVRAVLQEFNQWTQILELDAVYFLNAFQHGLIRSWIRVSTMMGARGLSPVIAAKVTVSGFASLVMKAEAGYLSSAKKYTRRVLWKNEKVNFSATLWTRDVWVDVACASFLKESVISAAMASLNELGEELKASIREDLKKEGLASALRYCGRLASEILRDTRNNLEELVAPGKLLELQTLLAGDESARKKADAEIRALADGRCKEARDELANVLGVPTKLLTQDE
jgi:DNA-sulfur modification-associated